MKNSKIIAVLMFITLGFAACQKENEPLMVSSPATAQRGASDMILPVFNCYPTTIKDATGNIEEQLTYNEKMQLVSMYNAGKEFMTFAYNANGKLERINHFADQTDKPENLKSYDLLIYPNNSSTAPSMIQRFVISYPNPNLGTEANRATTNINVSMRPTSIVEINYDFEGRKISEFEYTTVGKGTTSQQLYTYDDLGNVTSTAFYLSGVLKSRVQYDLFDNFKNIYINVGVLKLIPFNFTGTNNVTRILNSTKISETTSELAPVLMKHNDKNNCGSEVFKKYLYNSSGFPMAVTTITSDGDYTVKVDYKMPDIR